MKTVFSLLISLNTVVALAATPITTTSHEPKGPATSTPRPIPPDSNIIRYAKGKVAINKGHIEKEGDTYKRVDELICEKEILIPVNELKGGGNSQSELVECDTEVNSKPALARVYVGMYINTITNPTPDIPTGRKIKAVHASLNVLNKTNDPGNDFQAPQFANFGTETIDLDNMWLFIVPPLRIGPCSNPPQPHENCNPAEQEPDTVSAYIRIEDK